jgi:hypothetical protein
LVGSGCGKGRRKLAWGKQKSATSGKAGGLKKVEPLKAVRYCEPLKAVRL